MSQTADMPGVIGRMVDRLVREYAPRKVILFGSHTAGTADRDSDVDLLIIKETRDRFLDRWMSAQAALEGTHRSIPVDTLVLTPDELDERLRRGDQFIQEILSTGKVLYDAG